MAGRPNEPWWGLLMRLRANERFMTDPRWGATYLQLRAQGQSRVGNHAAALRLWDLQRSPRDSVGVLPPGARVVDAVTYLGGVADTARVLMINERHHAGADRLLTLRLLPLLYAKGYRYFARRGARPPRFAAAMRWRA